MIFTKAFWTAAAERAIKSFGQGAAAAWGAVTFTSVGTVISTGEAVLAAGISMAGLSILTSIASAQIGSNGPSLANEAIVPAPAPVVAS